MSFFYVPVAVVILAVQASYRVCLEVTSCTIQRIRELKQPRRSQQRKCHPKREFAPLQNFYLFFHLVHFVKCWRVFQELNSIGLYLYVQKKKH